MTDREAFLKAIEDNPFDLHLRKVYADYLDSLGDAYSEEAAIQRSWTAEKTRAVIHLEKCAAACDISYDDLLEEAAYYLKSGGRLEVQYIPQIMRDNAKFWESFSLITGIQVNKDEAGLWLVRLEYDPYQNPGCAC